MIRKLILITLGTLVLAVPAAQASTVDLVTTANLATLRFAAAQGEANRLSVTFANGVLTVRDQGAALQAGSGCSGSGSGEVTCPVPASLSKKVRTNANLGDGNDTAEVTGATTHVQAGPGDDVVTGGAGDDTIDGGGGRDELNGGSDGADVLSDGDAEASQFDADVLDGGTEIVAVGGDVVDYSDWLTAITVNLATGTGAIGPASAASPVPGPDVIRNVERALGGPENDVLTGLSNAPSLLDGDIADDRLTGGEDDDTLLGDTGDDTLDGNGGDDRLDGGDNGLDTLNGGAGDDYIDTGTPRDGRDEVTCGAGRDLVIEARFEDPLPSDCERVGSSSYPNLASAPARIDLRGRTVTVSMRIFAARRYVIGGSLTSGRLLARSQNVSRRRGVTTAKLKFVLRPRVRPQGITRAVLKTRIRLFRAGSSKPRSVYPAFYVRVD